ncbi:response regulator [Kamptonema animale CS-326]|jgi:DNA-binding response OmpR family regulator|uniref:response regulator n=1 Tax=Kamptonema animale TaxID=92934 RepID=UPI0023300147|nr:response regulator [Kamptonema animale]MDB9514248.1 response regulator [Kamptonema animale CS-326]
MSSKQVLFIHNHITFAEIVQAGLGDIDDWHISTVSSLKSMLIQISQNTPDLIILDFEHPEMNAVEILTMIRNYLFCFSPVVIFVTHLLTEQEENILTKFGVLNIIYKQLNSPIKTIECVPAY